MSLFELHFKPIIVNFMYGKSSDKNLMVILNLVPDVNIVDPIK